MPSMNLALYAPPVVGQPGNLAASSASSADSQFTFHDLLDIVNPLQHLPVIGTLYRAITGEHIGKLEKVAGDALYGGPWGAVSSIADLAFEGVTGKNIGDTVLALFTGSHDAKPPIAVAQSKTGPANPALPVALDITALTSALAQKGIDSDTAQRALFAYRKSAGLPAMVVADN